MCNVQPEADLGGKIISSPIPKPEVSVKTRLEVRGTASQKKYMGMGSAGLCDIYRDCRPWGPVQYQSYLNQVSVKGKC